MAKKDRRKETKKSEPARQVPSPPPASPPPPSALTDRETRNRVLRVLGQVAAVGLILFAMVWGRAYYSQQKFYREGEAALQAHNYKEAITGFEWTIRMYTPFSGKVKDACEKLWFIGNEYERRGRLDWALITYRSLRSSIYAVRSFYTPYAEWIPQADARIAQILEMQKAQAAAAASGKGD